MKFSIVILLAYTHTSQSHRHALGYSFRYLYLLSVALLVKCPYANNAFVSLLDVMICPLPVNTAVNKSFYSIFLEFQTHCLEL